MQYEEFLQAWQGSLQESGLRTFGFARETLESRSLERTYECFVEPAYGQGAEPFNVTAKLSWRWDALMTARTLTTEEDALTTLLGRDEVDELETERPWLRIDIELRASLPMDEGIALPAPKALAAWVRETMTRLASIEPLVPSEKVREADDGRLEVLAWKGDPRLEISCREGGRLILDDVSVAAFQLVELPRVWDDPEREADDDPSGALVALFRRVRSSIQAWMEATDHLLPKRSAS